MQFHQFKELVSSKIKPEGLPLTLIALWLEGIGQWDKAHDLVNEIDNSEGAWIHAYLHRKEGDIWNADYWYRRASRKRPDFTFEQEWEELTRFFLNEIV